MRFDTDDEDESREDAGELSAADAYRFSSSGSCGAIFSACA